MYIKKVLIRNIRSISHFEMSFDNPAGWHVLIGDNGAGKSTIVRSIAAALIGPEEIVAVRPNWDEWLSLGKDSGEISLEIVRDEDYDVIDILQEEPTIILNTLNFIRASSSNNKSKSVAVSYGGSKSQNLDSPNWDDWSPPQPGWFSAAYGPFRRFTGGNSERNNVFDSYPKAGAHLSVFDEDVALSGALEWLKELDYLRLKEKEEYNEQLPDSSLVFESLKTLLNGSGLLPDEVRLVRISANGPSFIDGNGTEVFVTQMSDGFRSILSLTFELIRQLLRMYSAPFVFQNITKGHMIIDIPGVVLIDEIDAHLHPTWQTRIGNWFTEHFSNMQFIVTTHSPLVCRASEKGSIWRLAAPGSQMESGEITGIERERLVEGNILDAYGTEIFGKSPVRSEKSEEKLKRLGRLNMLAALGKTSKDEENERLKLQQILSTDDPASS